jgi:uncharacterized protein YqeY
MAAETTTPDLKARLRADLTVAMKARDELSVSTLRLALSAIGNAEVAGDEAVALGDERVLELLAAEVKKRNDTATIYDDNNRPDAAARERAEIVVLERYLPAALGDDELATIIAEEVARAEADGATGGKAMGTVIKAVKARACATADGARIAAAVKSALA